MPKIIMINILVLIVLIGLVETVSYFSLSKEERVDTGWIINPPQHRDLLDPCTRMATHPLLSHVHDHRGKCEIKGGEGKGLFVYYKDKIDRKYKVAITLGGSTTDGFFQHFANGDTYPYLLDNILKKYAILVSVVNGGNGGYTSSQNLIKLLTEIVNLDLNIKYIISLNGINDTPGYGKEHKGYKTSHPFLTAIQHQMLARQQWVIQNPKAEKYIARLFPSTRLVISKLGDKMTIAFDPHFKGNFGSKYATRSAADQWLLNIKTMKSISASIGAEYFVFLQPTMGVSLKENDIDFNTPDGILYARMKSAKPEYFPMIRNLYRELRKHCESIDYCFDISNVAPPVGNLYKDARHHNDKGNAIIAETIYNLISFENTVIAE